MFDDDKMQIRFQKVDYPILQIPAIQYIKTTTTKDEYLIEKQDMPGGPRIKYTC